MLNGVGTAEQFLVRFFGAAEKEVWMRVGVIPQDVAAGRDFFHEARTFTDEFANDEEGGPGIVACEKVEKLGRDRGIRTVIEREREFAGRVSPTNRGPEELGACIHGGIGGERGGTQY